MLGEEAIIPNITSYPTPNPNPNPNPDPLLSHTDPSQYPYSQGSEFELAGAAPPAPVIGSISQTTYQHVGVPISEAANVILVPTMQPESMLPFHCEVCNISCNAKDALENHKIGKKHLKNVKKLGDSSAADAPQMAPPPVASVTEFENKKHRLLKNGATFEHLIRCDICNVVCNAQEVYQKHVAGKKHAAKAIIHLAGANAVFDATSDSSGGPQTKPDTLQCEICKITCTSNELLKAHIAGKKHLKKLKDSGLMPDMPLTPIASQDTPPTNDSKTVNSHVTKIVCELCGITCDTSEVFKNHVSGKKHQKKLKDLPLTPIASQDTPATNPMVNPESNEGKPVNVHEAKPTCELCEVSCDTIEMLRSHMIGKKHQKNLEKSETLIGPNPALATEAVAVATPVLIGPLQEEVKVVSSEGSKKKGKRGGVDEDVETKRQKVVQSGTASDAVQTCSICNVVCNSEKVFISHLGGQKHAAMAVKQAEAQATTAGQES